MSYYLEIVPKERIEYTSNGATIDRDKANIHEPLERIAYPANNGNGDWTEDVVITHEDGTIERVTGHVISDGDVSELEAEQ